MQEFSFTKEDFTLEWFSGTGPGGQNRNKKMACCRITHKQTGLKSHSTKHRNRVANQKDAFEQLAQLIIEHYRALDRVERDINTNTIRTYHVERNEVRDHLSGVRRPFDVIEDNLDIMIKSRKLATNDG